MSELATFDFGEHRFRILGTHDDPLWIASEVARVLGYRDAHDLTRRLDDDEKGTHSVRTPGGAQKIAVITESGLYSAILKSKRKEAKPFRRWVTSEVLPSIRKTGRYEIAQLKIAALLDEHIRPWVALFPEEYWSNLDRLCRMTRPDPSKRPMLYAQCVRLVYETFDAEVYAEMRNRVPTPARSGVRQHQTLSDVGRQCMQRHIARHIGLQDATSSREEYWRLVRHVFGKQLKLPLKGVRRIGEAA